MKEQLADGVVQKVETELTMEVIFTTPCVVR